MQVLEGATALALAASLCYAGSCIAASLNIPGALIPAATGMPQRPPPGLCCKPTLVLHARDDAASLGRVCAPRQTRASATYGAWSDIMPWCMALLLKEKLQDC